MDSGRNIPLRRQSSSIISPTNSAVSNIPVEDDDYGEDFDLSVSFHKRKQSGIPLEIAGGIGTSASKEPSLEQIADEEEGVAIQSSSRMSSFSPPVSPMPEFEELFSEDNRRLRYFNSIKFLSTRNIIILAFITVLAIFMTIHTPPEPDPALDVSRPVEADAPTEDGESHFEGVGGPLQFYTEVNHVRYYKSLDKMEEMKSEGPRPADRELGGMHVFENVCLTNNIDAISYENNPTTSLRGLIYFTRDQENNSQRCVPCSNSEDMDNWDGTYEDEKAVNHKCGMNGLHTMYATSAGDWSNCIMEEENNQMMKTFGQTQSPTNVTSVHFFQAPTFLLQFNAFDMESALFDMLMTYLPFWRTFEKNDFPFDSLISHSVKGCVSHSRHPFCELLHQMAAFWEVQDLPWESNENTLYCYKTLYVNQEGYNRNLEHDGHVTKEVFGRLREILFNSFGLPRRRTVEDREKDAKIEGQDLLGTKIILYDKKSKDETYWTDMEAVVTQAKSLEKYQDVTFVVVEEFDDLSVAQQARTFNEADAVVMVHGQHVANAIYAVDGTSFVGVGCFETVPLVGNTKFMELMDSSYRHVSKCQEDNEDGSEACVVCQDDNRFTITLPAFEKMIDDVIAK
eukprot:CAMPEP_0201691074 /NCGR_PEP_ID=MMETSP0578-20130828/4333_1 /ASSEMBLY_ACC=CAM_ASM_000663 /TAXON_ID=267565 /ORGANISM="Skeletonema grethea, Strain CCMP 1804" /LENGTH=623 /DNA_ID=CAMNT_0048176205 /DNA_START=250 /DNA_END=2121 /DNA_ORIENTATION=-